MAKARSCLHILYTGRLYQVLVLGLYINYLKWAWLGSRDAYLNFGTHYIFGMGEATDFVFAVRSVRIHINEY